MYIRQINSESLGEGVSHDYFLKLPTCVSYVAKVKSNCYDSYEQLYLFPLRPTSHRYNIAVT